MGVDAPQRSFLVAQLPAQSPGVTGYLTLLSLALTRAGVEVTSVDRAALWRLGWRRDVDLVHLHWLEFIAPSAPGGLGLLRTMIRDARLIAALTWLRLRGIRLVWTVHNLEPHEPAHPRLEELLGMLVSRISHALVAHSAYARSRIHERWGSAVKVAVIPHGNYIGVFARPKGTRADIRRSLGIPDDAYVFLAFGQVRAYKRLTDLVEALGALPSDDVRLLIAGKPVAAEEVRRLRDAAASDPRVVLDLRQVPDEEVSALHLCADAAVLAYRDVFSSGALLLALSFGLPVVAPNVGTAAELVGSHAGELFGPGGLTAALDSARATDQPSRAAAAAAVARQYGWDRVGTETAALYYALATKTISSANVHRR
ncbi:MAG TPA: glycosyltransferase [Solirubrobacteraceae bacterium]|nr:glycosyltransferase [Solirubrobacteraceae bacterium]